MIFDFSIGDVDTERTPDFLEKILQGVFSHSSIGGKKKSKEISPGDRCSSWTTSEHEGTERCGVGR